MSILGKYSQERFSQENPNCQYELSFTQQLNLNWSPNKTIQQIKINPTLSHHERGLKDFNLLFPTVNINSLHSFLHFSLSWLYWPFIELCSQQVAPVSQQEEKETAREAKAYSCISLDRAKPSVLNVVTNTLKCAL